MSDLRSTGGFTPRGAEWPVGEPLPDWMPDGVNVRRRRDGWAVLMGRDYRWYAIQNDGDRMTDERGATRMFGDDKAAMEFVDRFHSAKRS